MIYCTKCKTACDDSMQKCPNCKSQKELRQIKEDDMVYLNIADQYTASKLEEKLKASEIVYELKPIGDGKWFSYMYDSEIMPTDKTIYVQYKFLEASRELAEETRVEIEEENKPAEEFEEMSPKKRIVVQIISVILFLLLVTGVVLGADFIADALKNFFTGLKG